MVQKIWYISPFKNKKERGGKIQEKDVKTEEAWNEGWDKGGWVEKFGEWILFSWPCHHTQNTHTHYTLLNHFKIGLS